MKTLGRMTSAALGAALVIDLGLSVLPAQAGYVVDLTQEVIGGVNDVVANGSGPIDLTGLGPSGSSDSLAFLQPSVADIVTGPTNLSNGDAYNGVTLKSFGSGGVTLASSGSGDVVGIFTGLFGDIFLFVPLGYVSGSPLSDTSTYSGQTFASLGVTPGVYEAKWGTGPNQNFTLDIGPTAVPEPSTWAMMLLGFAGLGFAGWRARGRGVSIA